MPWTNRRCLHFGMILLLGITMTVCIPACSHQTLSIDEAKQVTMSVQKASFVPPPRRSYDVIELLERPDRADSQLARALMRVARADPPRDLASGQMARFLLKRGKAAQQVGLVVQAREDLQRALFLARITKLERHDYKFFLGSVESVFGNYRRTEELVAQSARESGYLTRYSYMVKHFARMGDLEGARKWRREGLQHYREILRRYPKARRNAFIQFARAEIEAVVLEAQGLFREAEPYRRTMVRALKTGSKGEMPSYVLYYSLGLVSNLKSQGRLVEAELEARQAIAETVAFGGKGTPYCAMAIQLLGKILIKQNRLTEARALLITAIEIIAHAGLPSDMPLIGVIRLDLVQLLAVQGDFADAARQFEQAQACFAEPRFFLGKLLFQPKVFAALIIAGRDSEALALLDAAHRELVLRLGEAHPRTILLVGLRGMAQDAMGNFVAAANNYKTALPTLLAMNMRGGDKAGRRWLVRVILEAYLDHLATTRQTKDDVNWTAFQIAEALRHRALQQAISARSARAAISDPALEDLSRREQDARRQISVLEVNLSNVLAAPSDQVDAGLVENLSAQLEQLKLAHQTIQSEIRATDPRYADHTEPRTMTLKDIRSLLRPDEALLTIYTTRENTFVWGISVKGAPRMAVVPIGKQKTAALVGRIRLSLDASPATLGEIPAFDLSAAHRLYQMLLAPVSETWSAAREVLVVSNAPLDRIPLGILPLSDKLPTAPADDLLFEKYRRVDWLIRHAAVSRHASVAAFATLRRTPVQAPTRQPFAGFGNPTFDPAYVVSVSPADNSQDGISIRERRLAIRVRGVRVTSGGSLDDESLRSTRLQDLVSLPDTEDEIRGIAKSLKAAPEESIFLGRDASESRIKSMNLADRRVIAFATHALVPGDLDGLVQPALALSSPEATGGNDDGLLTMGEIMTLRLNADWIVLSACNTGLGDGSGAEALSGLGQAFFYAGSRALLVSLWPVETSSARQITTGVFQRQMADPRMGRARALQQSILALLDNPGLPDPVTGKLAASYAHPLFWAPFILVGEGAADQSRPLN